MPVHDWNRIEPGIFHDFHQAWIIELRNSLNGGVLPAGYFAMTEQIISGPIPDVVTLERETAGEPHPSGGVAVADAPPQARFVTSAEIDAYALKANRLAVKHRLGRVIAVIEIVSPGNKASRHALRSFVEKAEELLRAGISLLIVDVFEPSSRDPQGIHKAIWDQIREEPFELPPDKPLTACAYSAAQPITAYVEPMAVGDPLPALPIFLAPGVYVPAPLESSYATTWDKCPTAMKQFVKNPHGP